VATNNFCFYLQNRLIQPVKQEVNGTVILPHLVFHVLTENYFLNSFIYGCDGADSGRYGQFFAATLKGQSVHEVNYPYLNTNPKLTCPAGKKIYNSGAYVVSPLPDYACTEAKLMSLVSTYGAAVSYIYASDSAFGNYANGVFSGCTSQSINHAILVVGYGTDAASGKNYWLVKNSWGTGWGANGFIKIYRGNNQGPML
jgi:C1A family cysteine protease